MKNEYLKNIKHLLPKIKRVKLMTFENFWSETPHVDQNNELLYIQEGYLNLWTPEKEILLKKGDVAFLAAKTLHRDMFETNNNPKVFLINFELKNINNLSNSVCLSETSKHLIEKEVQRISKDYEFDKTLANLSLIKIMTIIENNKKDIPKSKTDILYKDITEQIKAIIKKEYKNNISLEYLSKKLDKSTYHISHIFNKYSGMSLPDYVTKVRMDNAARMLIGTNKNISEIAYTVGYDDPHYFTNIFKKYYDMTPKEYRNIIKQGTII